MVSGGFRPTASQNDPMSVSGNGGNGQSGNFAAQKAAKAAQLRMSGLPQGENQAMAQTISEGGNVATTANAANPASQIPQANMADLLSSISPLDAEPDTYLPSTDGVDFGPGRGSEAIPPSLNANNRQIENVDLVKRYLPDLLNAARMPGAPDSYKRMINSLMRELM